MAVDDDGTTAPIARALEAARANQPEGWAELADAIMRRVGSLTVPAYPLVVRELPDGSRTSVSTRALQTALRVVLSQSPTHAPSGIRVELDDDRVVGVEVALVAAYGLDLVALADEVRPVVAAEVAGLTGRPIAPSAVTVDVVDVVDGDPRLV